MMIEPKSIWLPVPISKVATPPVPETKFIACPLDWAKITLTFDPRVTLPMFAVPVAMRRWKL